MTDIGSSNSSLSASSEISGDRPLALEHTWTVTTEKVTTDKVTAKKDTIEKDTAEEQIIPKEKYIECIRQFWELYNNSKLIEFNKLSNDQQIKEAGFEITFFHKGLGADWGLVMLKTKSDQLFCVRFFNILEDHVKHILMFLIGEYSDHSDDVVGARVRFSRKQVDLWTTTKKAADDTIKILTGIFESEFSDKKCPKMAILDLVVSYNKAIQGMTEEQVLNWKENQQSNNQKEHSSDHMKGSNCKIK